jgi:anti-anti-sigma regulatory factor
MNNLIKIKDQYLIFRDQAKVFEKVISKKLKEKNNSEVCLDFSQVHFISRSFADELLEIINYFQKEKSRDIKVINQNSLVSQLFSIVKKQKGKIKKELSLQI